MVDTRNKLQALQHDSKTRETHLKWLKGIIANGAVLTRGQGDDPAQDRFRRVSAGVAASTTTPPTA